MQYNFQTRIKAAATLINANAICKYHPSLTQVSYISARTYEALNALKQGEVYPIGNVPLDDLVAHLASQMAGMSEEEAYERIHPLLNAVAATLMHKGGMCANADGHRVDKTGKIIDAAAIYKTAAALILKNYKATLHTMPPNKVDAKVAKTLRTALQTTARNAAVSMFALALAQAFDEMAHGKPAYAALLLSRSAFWKNAHKNAPDLIDTMKRVEDYGAVVKAHGIKVAAPCLFGITGSHPTANEATVMLGSTKLLDLSSEVGDAHMFAYARALAEHHNGDYEMVLDSHHTDYKDKALAIIDAMVG